MCCSSTKAKKGVKVHVSLPWSDRNRAPISLHLVFSMQVFCGGISLLSGACYGGMLNRAGSSQLLWVWWCKEQVNLGWDRLSNLHSVGLDWLMLCLLCIEVHHGLQQRFIAGFLPLGAMGNFHLPLSPGGYRPVSPACLMLWLTLIFGSDVFNKRFMQERTWNSLQVQTWGWAN